MIDTSNAAQALELAHQSIRQGDFDLDLLRVIDECHARWDAMPPRERLRGIIVEAEIRDYYGHYFKAEKLLRDFEPADVLIAVEANEGNDPTLRRRQVWLVLAKAQVLYRSEDYPEARELLLACGDVLFKVDPGETAYYGTRARLALFLGQTYRQLGNYDKAVHQFAESVRFANARFRAKTPFAELSEPGESPRPLSEKEQAQFDASRKLAHWTTARALAMGTGWIRYTTGLLENATVCLNAGAALLRTTGDSFHRAYCQLLLAAVERAKHAASRPHLEAAIETMKNAAHGLSTHRSYSIRAHYELAIAYLHLRDDANAEASITTFKDLVDTSDEYSVNSRRQSRWACHADILRSRLARLRNHNTDAETHARAALKLARASNLSDCEIEALIAAGEAVSVQAVDSGTYDRAIRDLEEARHFSEGNPKTAAVCTLHLASIHKNRGDFVRARDEFTRWNTRYRSIVEHGFVRALAAKVSEGMWPEQGVLRLDGMQYERNDALLRRALLDAVEHLSIREQEIATGMSRRRLNEWRKELEPLRRDRTPPS